MLTNVTYSYTIVAIAAKSVQESEKWCSENKINTLVFSNKWVQSFLKRGGVSRRKITSDDKQVPTDAEVRRILEIGQNMYIEKEHEPHTCYNFDETAFTYSIGPTHIFCPKDQQRATNIGISNTKQRITAVIAVNGVGQFAPLMLIIKHSVSSETRPDQERMMVIPELRKKDGFTARDGWEIGTWEKDLTFKSVTALHRCTYLRHTVTGNVITSQVKAWNDTTRMVMWFELVMKPIRERLKKIMLWCDNCGSHKTSSVRYIITETMIDVTFLTPNMIGEHQVLDLVVNGPIKARVKNKRATTASRHSIRRDSLIWRDSLISVPRTFVTYEKSASSGKLSVIPQGTLDFESGTVTNEFSDANQEMNFERGLFARYIESIDGIEEYEDQDEEDSGEREGGMDD